MFYSHQLLARKAPLGQIWMAATMHAKINRRKLDKLNIIKICEEILYPSVPMALRLSGILMGGVVIVYERKVKLLYDDVTRLLVEINEAWKLKSVPDPTVLPKGKTQAKFEAVTLPVPPDHGDEEVEQSMQFSDAGPTMARFRHHGGFRMQLDDFDEPYFKINTGDDNYSDSHHQADVENITLFNYLDSSLAEADLNNRFERFDIEADEEPQFNFTADEQPQVPSTLIPSPPSHEGAEQVNHHSISSEVDGIKDHHMEEQQEQHDEGHRNEAGPGREAQVANQDDKKKMPMKRKGRANATRVIVDNEHLMIPCNIYQSWLHDTGDIVSKRGRKKEDFYREQNLFRSTRIGDLLELPLVPFIPGLEKFQDEVYYPAPLMDLLKKGAKKHTAHDSSLGGKSQGQTQAQVSHSPPEELYPPDLPEFRVDDFQSEIGSQTMHVSIEKLRANLENLNFQGLLDEHTGNSFVTPGSPGRSANSIPSSGSRHSVLPLEPVIQLPSGRSKRKQNSASTNSLGNLDPVGEDVPMQQSVRDFKLRKLTENVPTPDLELLEETEPTQTPGPKYVDSSIDKITQSIRTHLKVHFDTPGAPEFESLNQLAFGMNNKKAAQLFYQTCVLATHDFVKVQQTVPYGDITISRGPKM